MGESPNFTKNFSPIKKIKCIDYLLMKSSGPLRLSRHIFLQNNGIISLIFEHLEQKVLEMMWVSNIKGSWVLCMLGGTTVSALMEKFVFRGRVYGMTYFGPLF